MTNTQIEAAILQILVAKYRVKTEGVTPDTLLFRPEGLALSSVNALNLVLELEEHFGVAFTELDLTSQLYAHSLGSLAALVAGRLEA